MEHNPLDESIKRIIKDNIDHRVSSEVNSREVVWNQLEINRPKKILPLLRLAAACALLILGGSTIYLTSQFQKQRSRYGELEKKYQEMERNWTTLKTKESNDDSITSRESQIERITDTIRITELKYVVQYDTIYRINDSTPQTIVVHQIDTLYLPSPETMPVRELVLIDTTVNNNQRPSSVEFLFNAVTQNDIEKKKDKGPVLILNGNTISQD